MSESTFIPIFGFGTKGKSSNVTAQKRINLYLEQSDDKTQLAIYTRPGLTQITPTIISTGSGVPSGGSLGMMAMAYNNGGTQSLIEYTWIAYKGAFVVLTSTSQKMIGGAATGEALPGAGRVSFAYNGQRGFAVDGSHAWYLVPSNAVANDCAAVAGVFPWTGATSVCFIAGRFVCNYPNAPGQFCWSPLFPYIMQPWNGLDYATAESSPDALVAVSVYNGALVLWGTTTIEFWAPSTGTEVFSNVQGSTAQWGLVAQWSVATLADSCYFLGRNANGQAQVCLLNGYQVKVVSTPDIEFEMNKQPVGDANARAFSIAGHDFYEISIGTRTWTFDANNGTWAEWQTSDARWAGEDVVAAYGKLLVADYRDQRLYVLDQDALTDGGELMAREIVTKHVAFDNNRFSLQELAVEFEYGTGLVMGQGSDPQVMLQISRDGGHTWGAELWRALGKLGEYAKRVFWTRLGRARDYTFRLRISDPVKVVILNAALRISK